MPETDKIYGLINQLTLQHEAKESLNEELQEDIARSCKSKGCNCNKHDDECELECDCVCKPKHNHNHKHDDECEPCEVESDECVDNVCGEECCTPLASHKFSTANSVPLAIETNRIFDSIKFQVFTDADAPNGEDLFFEYEVVSVNGPIPRSGVVNVNIDKVCMNYTDVIIQPGCTTLEDHIVRAIKEAEKEPCEQENLCPEFGDIDGEFCKTSFEYNVCGNQNRECSSKGKGERAAYKEKGLKVIVKNLVLELRGKCGCTDVTVLAYPARRTGNGVMVFSMDGEASIVGEGENKPAGDASFTKKTITPIKIVYQHRLTDEFINMSEEKQLPYLEQFVDGLAKKMARAVDIMGFQGVNPADGVESAKIGTNCFAKAVKNKVTYAAVKADENLDDAVALIQEKDCDVTGIAMAPAFASALGKIKAAGTGTYLYPEFRFGNKPANFGGMANSVNNTVAFKNSKIRAVVGDFTNAFKWGYAEQVPMKIIEYGDPDGQGDLQRTNQIVLRAETYVGFCVLDPDAFALITTESVSGS